MFHNELHPLTLPELIKIRLAPCWLECSPAVGGVWIFNHDNIIVVPKCSPTIRKRFYFARIFECILDNSCKCAARGVAKLRSVLGECMPVRDFLGPIG